jgi:hypothetical protein
MRTIPAGWLHFGHSMKFIASVLKRPLALGMRHFGQQVFLDSAFSRPNGRVVIVKKHLGRARGLCGQSLLRQILHGWKHRRLKQEGTGISQVASAEKQISGLLRHHQAQQRYVIHLTGQFDGPIVVFYSRLWFQSCGQMPARALAFQQISFHLVKSSNFPRVFCFQQRYLERRGSGLFARTDFEMSRTVVK